MRNKGAIWFLAISLALVSVYQLSFTWKAASVKKAAREYATGKDGILNDKKEAFYLDSISGETVYNFLFGLKKYTYKDCQARELNLGLDLKGGMDVILEVSVEDVIRSLSNYSKDSTFNAAINLAKKMQKNSQEDFVSLFGKAFETIDPNAKMAAIFNTVELRDKINFNSTNQQVLAVLKQEADDAVSNSFNIIRTRIDQFGVTQPNIQRLETNDRILVDLPGVKDQDRVKKLLQGTANLEFWETYENSEIYPSLLQANKVVKQVLDAEKALQKEKGTKDSTVKAKTGSETQVKSDTSKAKGTEPTLLKQIQESDTLSTTSDSLKEAGAAENYPLFSVLYPNVDQQGNVRRGADIGYAHSRDTATVDRYMRIAMEHNVFPRDFKYLWDAKPIDDPQTKKPTDFYKLFAIKMTGRDGKPPLDGDVVTSAAQEFNQNSGYAYVTMGMNGEGAKIWARITRENVGREVIVAMDNLVYSDAVVQGEIAGGNTEITGNFSVNDAMDLANLLKSGKLPAPARIIQESIVGPSLGKEAVTAGLSSFIIAFILVLIYMVFYYSRRAGLVADIALVINLVFIFGVLASLGAALTLPGIAGIVLTMGMAVDANVLIYERIKEEIAAGKGVKLALSDGYKNAYSAIIDGNATTGITGLILYLFGTGPIKGFATTLVIGIITSLFTAIFITRLIYEWYLKKHYTLSFSTKLTANAFKKVHIDFIGKRKIFYGVSGTIILIGIISLFIRGLDYGVDFTGGRNFIIRFPHAVSTVNVANDLTPQLNEAPKVITYGKDNQVRITTRYRVNDEGEDVDNDIQNKLYLGLKPIIGDTVSYNTFQNVYIQGDQKVGPTIADDIRREAVIAVTLALVFMFFYILLRFRNWQYGMGAIAALMHDSLIVIGLFSILWGHMAFSMEIDQAFIAAILTVVGYSVNDTVIIFDRLREYLGIYKKRDRGEVMNMAMNSTLSRTFSTSMTTIVVLIAIFFFGGEVIRGFIFALLIGIVVGTYSSVFVATPLVYDTLSTEEKIKSKRAKK
jgi:SecD/SecF fusion protein